MYNKKSAEYAVASACRMNEVKLKYNTTIEYNKKPAEGTNQRSMGGAQIKLGDPVCSDNRRPDATVWFALGRTGFCDSPVMEGLPAEGFTLPDSEAALHGGNLLSDTIGEGVFFQLLTEYAKLVE